VGDDGRVGRKIAAIERNIDRASRIARELLHFSREKEAALEPISINQVLTSALNLLQHQQLSSIVHLNLRDVPAVMGIPWKLEEVFVNLLMNSLDACGEGNRIEVTTSCAGNRVVVVIADTGHGIDQEQLGKVFDPFFTTREIGKGTGLGLSVCHNIVKQHGGDIELKSSKEKGTQVTVSFPGVADEN